jgi:acetyl-CoA carboxylase biotin carboxylase subunit
MFKRILIANRGEIAIRISRACREMGVSPIAIYSEADADGPHVRVADRAVCVGPAPSNESYLNADSILAAAKSSGADAIHPGYGFLSENPLFARTVRDAGLTFIGPTPEAMTAMADKTLARNTVAAAGVPVAPAAQALSGEADPALLRAAEDLGFPILIKAAAGGGGKGMRIVRSSSELVAAYAAAEREARGAFGDGRLFLERYFERARHIEVQVLADHHGNVIHLGERECSIQRRHQKIVEETPSPAVTEAIRGQLTAAAIAAAKSVGYTNAGTVEFLFTEDGDFYFLEMNTRLQVEHPITEWVTGIDLVQAQIRVAAGEPLGIGQDDVRSSGHAIECRVYAEDPANQFLPSPGRIAILEEPCAPWVRVDSGIRADYEVPLHYDPMLAKLSVWGATREQARRRMIAALRDYIVLGPTTTIPFLRDLLQHAEFANGNTHTHFIQEHLASWQPDPSHLAFAATAAAVHAATAAKAAFSPEGERPMGTPWQTLGGWRLGSGGPPGE